MTAGLIPAEDGSDRLTVDREALIARWVEAFCLDVGNDAEVALARREADHVAQLVDAALAEQAHRYERKLRRALAGARLQEYFDIAAARSDLTEEQADAIVATEKQAKSEGEGA
jgi:hypothetical protein